MQWTERVTVGREKMHANASSAYSTTVIIVHVRFRAMYFPLSVLSFCFFLFLSYALSPSLSFSFSSSLSNPLNRVSSIQFERQSGNVEERAANRDSLVTARPRRARIATREREREREEFAIDDWPIWGEPQDLDCAWKRHRSVISSKANQLPLGNYSIKTFNLAMNSGEESQIDLLRTRNRNENIELGETTRLTSS